MAESRKDGEAKPTLEPRSGVNTHGIESVHCDANSPDLKAQLSVEKKGSKQNSLRKRFSFLRMSNRNAHTEKEIGDQSFSNKKHQVLGDQRQKDLRKSQTVQTVTEEATGKAKGSVGKRPLSVMQIHELIQNKNLQEAFSSIKLLEDELLTENNSKKYEDNGTEYYRKAKDVNLLYDCLFDIMKSIVEDALGKANCDGQLVASVVEVINEEEIAHCVHGREAPISESNGLGIPKKWKVLWRESVSESIKKRVHSFAIPLKEKNRSWLAVHLDDLKTNVTHDLLKIKHSVKNHYPEDYKVCDLYVTNFHSAISSHLKENILNQSLEFEELYALLDWIVNIYCGEDLMGNTALKPEVNIESLPPLLEPHVLKKLKDDYSRSLTKKMNEHWEKILEMEVEKWKTEEEPKREDFLNQGCYRLPMYIDIQQMTEQYLRESGKLCKDLESAALQICLEGLQQFIKRLEKEFMAWDKDKSSSMFVPYLIVYINCFLELRADTEKGDASDFKDRTTNVLTMAIQSCKEYFFSRLKLKTQLHFRQLLTDKWISSTVTFDTLKESIRMSSQPLKYLKRPLNEEFVAGVHKYVVKEYITQIMLKKTSLKRSNREKAAQKMAREAKEMSRIILQLDSATGWLFPAIYHISTLIGIKKEEEIKENLEKIYHEYPDISEEHVLAILNFRGTGRSKKLSVVEHFKTLQKENTSTGNEVDRVLFADIEVNTLKCFSLIG